MVLALIVLRHHGVLLASTHSAAMPLQYGYCNPFRSCMPVTYAYNLPLPQN